MLQLWPTDMNPCIIKWKLNGVEENKPNDHQNAFNTIAYQIVLLVLCSTLQQGIESCATSASEILETQNGVK